MSMMKGFSNAFRIPELRKKILVTLGLVFVCRLVSQIPTPGVDFRSLSDAFDAVRGNGGGMLDWFNMFTGGALSQCAVGFLSIWPYISAQIVIQLLSSVIPSLEKLKKEGESGRMQLAQITRYLTIVLCVVQAWGIASALSNPQIFNLPIDPQRPIVAHPGLAFNLMTVICMTSASLFVMWLADQITTFGVGNGASMIIMINITSRLPSALEATYDRYFGALSKTSNLFELPVLICIFMVVVMLTVMLVQGVRKVKIHSTRRMVSGGNSFGMQQSFMPLKVNYTGVMPIIFAQPLIQIPSTLIANWTKDKGGFLAQVHEVANNFANALANPSITYMVLYAVLIVFFTFFWVATQFNAIDISESLKRDSSYLPGVRPGRETAVYLDDVMTKITLLGAAGLVFLAIFPMALQKWMHVPHVISSFFGGTSLLIIVGVALDTLRILESHLLIRKYEGFLEHGAIRGRGGM